MSTSTPGWNPDPSGRHEYRYWDGSSWTDDVSDHGVTSTDPVGLPGAPGGPTEPAPTTPTEPTQPFGQAPPPGGYPTGPPSDTYPGAGGPSGGYPTGAPSGPYPVAGGPGGPGGPGGYDPYGTGGLPPTTPPRKRIPRGLVIGGIIAVLALIIGLVAIFAAGDDDDETSTDDETTTTVGDTTTTTGDTTETTEGSDGSESTDVFSLGVGDCVTDESEMTGEVTDVPIIDCAEPHASEVFHSYMIPDPSLPDQAGIEAIVQEQCLPAFESFIGLAYDSSVLEVNYLSPTPDSWDAGDRELLCLVYDPSGNVTGTLAGANR